jgi:hypothetical protein
MPPSGPAWHGDRGDARPPSARLVRMQGGGGG